jgi:hypothetical protein
MVGPRDGEGQESFDIEVCTPAWLAKVCEKDGFVIGRHVLIVNDFEQARIRKIVVRMIERCSGDTWKEVAEKVGRLGYWEFEDYQPAKD